MTDPIPTVRVDDAEPGVCIDFGDYRLKIKAGIIMLENSAGEAMHVKNEEFRALLDHLFKERF